MVTLADCESKYCVTGITIWITTFFGYWLPVAAAQIIPENNYPSAAVIDVLEAVAPSNPVSGISFINRGINSSSCFGADFLQYRIFIDCFYQGSAFSDA